MIASTAIPSPKTIVGYQGKKRKILVVDDRWENCAVPIDLLEPLGFELTQAANGQEGLEKAIEVQPDLILVDLYHFTFDALHTNVPSPPLISGETRRVFVASIE